MIFLGREPEACLDPAFEAGLRAMAAEGLSWDFCCLSPALPAFTQLVRRVPEMSFILDHCGHNAVGFEEWAPDDDLFDWKAAMTELASAAHAVSLTARQRSPASPPGRLSQRCVQDGRD